jgi:nitrite reductase/ring-hydroxylating ferredoxin subunit
MAGKRACDAGALEELQPGELRVAEVAGARILLYRIGNRVLVIPSGCPHRGSPLEAGSIDGAALHCAAHDAVFDLRTGARLRGPACADLDVEHAVVEDGRIWVHVDDSAEVPCRT